ncbi:AAA-ATPase At3g50940-like [Phoenix dactylifera]|uniref:AAA-ATPase At3g50940-like n=1 Tax=Phoenix dactylifera TaxID=42345 RepID=A0A8B7CI54_PHODC|nr:AAA-ATPase At3g50940-like [Phoenix dactylifera]
MEVVLDWKSIGSLLATLVFLRSALRDFLPPELYFFLQFLFRRLVAAVHPTAIIIIDEYDGSSPNELYEAAQSYLGSRCLATAPVVRLSKPRQAPHPIASLPSSHTAVDFFQGVPLRWTSRAVERPSAASNPFLLYGHHRSSSAAEHRSLELSFHRRHRNAVHSIYIPHILDEAARLRLKARERRLYTNRAAPGEDLYRLWSSVPFAHPSTFDTLAIEPALKDDLRSDLLRFADRRDHYARVGRTWKRGYLLHGPPGTGKTSLVAAIANLLEFDVYDLELTAVPSNSHLRRLLVSTTPKSVVVVEDIDCSLDLSDRKKKKKTKPGHEHEPEPDLQAAAAGGHPHDVTAYGGGTVSLSGVLNFVDGLWSSCVGERLMIFTTNHPERLDPALIRPGRMDRSIHLSYCRPSAFRVLARNYLDVAEGHQLMPEVDALLQEVKITPADVAEVFMGCDGDGSDAAMRKLVDELRRRKAPMPSPPPLDGGGSGGEEKKARRKKGE